MSSKKSTIQTKLQIQQTSIVSIRDDDDQESSSVVTLSSKKRKLSAVGPSQSSRFDTDDGKQAELAVMEKHYQAVIAKCRDVYPAGLTQQMVQELPILQYFVHRVPTTGDGIREDASGYMKSKKGENSVTTEFVCHKLVYCHSKQECYSRSEGDISHDCHNRGCCRLEHLSRVSHRRNSALSRGAECGGWVFNTSTRQLICNCTHEQKCMWLRVISNDVVFDPATATANIFSRGFS